MARSESSASFDRYTDRLSLRSMAAYSSEFIALFVEVGFAEVAAYQGLSGVEAGGDLDYFAYTLYYNQSQEI